MTLTTHAVVGAAVAGWFPDSPLFGFAAGFMSHFILDSIPHWDYKLESEDRDTTNKFNSKLRLDTPAFRRDLRRIMTDGLLGLFLAAGAAALAGVFGQWWWLAGAAGGVLPDGLQFFYQKYHREPLVALQRFHMWIHADLRLDDQPVFGIGSQLFIILAVLLLWVG